MHDGPWSVPIRGTGLESVRPLQPGCVVAGITRDEVLDLMCGAVELHIEDSPEEGEVGPAWARLVRCVPIGGMGTTE